MQIDPVVVLAEELRSAEHTVRTAREKNEDDTLTCLLARTVSLYNEIRETVPTSALGAGELVGLAAANLASIDSAYAKQMRDTANRLRSGVRQQGDLIWLRMMAVELAEGRFGEIGRSTAALLYLAIRGAARPIVVYRAVEWTPDNAARKADAG